MAGLDLAALVASCAPLVAPGTALALIDAESKGNVHAIGVVGGALTRQPRTALEALATTQALDRQGRDYSLGLAQINRRNFARLGLTPATAFEPCRNLAAMQVLLGDCYARAPAAGDAQLALRQALSCYYSGNFRRGFTDGYVQAVVRAHLSRRPPRRGTGALAPHPSTDAASGRTTP